jgi:hypothetical protein
MDNILIMTIEVMFGVTDGPRMCVTRYYKNFPTQTGSRRTTSDSVYPRKRRLKPHTH